MLELTYTKTVKDVNRPETTSSYSQYVPNGEYIRRAKTVKGDHIHDLPYWIDVTTINNLCGDVTSRYEQIQKSNSVVLRQTTDVFSGCWHKPIVFDDFIFKINSKDQAKCQQLAITKALANARRANVNTGMLLKERTRTISMIRDRSSRILNGAYKLQQRDLQAFKRLKSSRARRAYAQRAASSHLEAIFGWAPLFDEISGALEHLAEPTYVVHLARGRHSFRKSFKTSSNQNGDRRANSYAMREVTKTLNVFSSRATLKYTIENQGLRDAQKLGANAAYLLYDSVPLSFVTGWFSNLNHVIQALDPILGSSYLTGSVSNRQLQKIAREIAYDYGGFPDMNHSTFKRTISGGFNVVSGEKAFTQRVVLSREPSTEFMFYNNLSMYSVTAGLSLFLQRRLKPLNLGLKTKSFRYRGPKVKNLPPIPYVRRA